MFNEFRIFWHIFKTDRSSKKKEFRNVFKKFHWLTDQLHHNHRQDQRNRCQRSFECDWYVLKWEMKNRFESMNFSWFITSHRCDISIKLSATTDETGSESNHDDATIPFLSEKSDWNRWRERKTFLNLPLVRVYRPEHFSCDYKGHRLKND